MDLDLLVAATKALHVFYTAHEKDESLKAFEEMYKYLDIGDPDGWPEELLYDPQTQDFYLSYFWEIHGLDEEIADTVIVKITPTGELTELDYLPHDDFQDVSDLIPDLRKDHDD